MAQVRKLQNGPSIPEKKKEKEEEVLTESKPVATETSTPTSTSTPTQEPVKPKYGRFFRGTRTLEGELGLNRLNDIDAQGKGGLFTAAALAAYRAGHDVYSGNDGSFQIKDANGNDITDQYITRKTSHTDDSALRRNLGATFNSQRHQDRLNNELLMGINMDPEKVETPDNRIELRRGSGWFDFNKDKAYDTTSSFNLDSEQRIRQMIDYAMGDETAMNDKYKYGAWSDADRTTLRGLGDEFAAVKDENGSNIYADNLIKSIRENNLSDAQLRLLKLMGFNKDAVSGSGSGSDGDGNEDEENPYQLEGVDPELMQQLGITGIHSNKDKNGNTYWTVDGDQFANSTWDLSGFSDFDNTAFKGGWIYNGRLYTSGSENTVEPLRRATLAYRGNNAPTWDEWWRSANNSGVRFFGDEASGGTNPYTQFDYQTMYDRVTNTNPTGGVIWDFAKKNNLSGIGIRDVTAGYGKGDWERLYSYVDTNDRNSRGIPIQKFFNEKGEIIANPGPEVRTPGTYTNNLSFSNVDTSGSAINGMFVHGTYTNPNGGGQITLMRDASGGYHVYREGANGKSMKPINIDPSRISELMEMIKTGWKWSDIEGMKRASSGNRTAVSGSNGRSASSGTTLSYGYRKNGGTIDWNKLQKLQWGGYVNNTAAPASTIDNTKESDITKAHAVDGTDGGLTSAEKWQIAGAIGDLVGVGTSFAGIAGGFAGAGAGFAGTAAKFVGDVKKDGLQFRDVKNLLLNTAFDVASLPASAIPGLDNLLKGAKFLKTIKSVGAPMLKWLGTIGASSAVINTASRAINGEKLNSQDLAQSVQGIAGGLVAGKQWAHQIGDAKLAATLSKRAASGVTTPTKTKVGDTEIENSVLEQIVKDAKGDANAIKNAIKQKLNLADDTKIDLESLGLTKNRRGAWAWIRGKERTFSYEQPKEEEATSAVEFFLRNRARNKALGYRDATPGKGQQNLLGNMSAQEYQQIASSGTGSMSGALRRAGMYNPSKFNFEMNRELTIPSVWGNNYYRGATAVSLYANRFRGAPFRNFSQMPWVRNVGPIRYAPSITPVSFNRKLVVNKEGGLIPKYALGGFSGKPFELDEKYLPAALDLGEAIRSQVQLNKAYKQDEKALRGLKDYSVQASQSPLLDFNASPYLQDYINTKNTYLSALGPNTYADLGLSAANNQATAQALGKLSSQTGANISNAVYQNDVNNNAIMAQNEKNRIDAANTNSQYQTQINYQIDALKAQKTRDQNANIWAPISNQFRQNMRTNINRASQLSAQFELQKLNDELKQQQMLATKALRDEWRAKFDKGEYKGSFDDYVVSDEIINQRYRDLLNTEKNPDDTYKTTFGKYYNDTYLPARRKTLLGNSLALKSGGTVKRTVQEEIAINADKMSKKAVEKMSDNLMKLLQQLLK